MRFCVLDAEFIFWRSKNFLFLFRGQRVYNFEESPRSIRDVIGDVFCPGKYCFNRDKCKPLDSYVTTPRSIYGCGKCGAWLFVHKAPFMLQEHVKTTKTDETRSFVAKKTWNWCPTNNCYSLPHFNQPNLEGKNCAWTTKYKRLMKMCYVQHVETKSVFTFLPIKRPVSTAVESAKPAATFWIFLLRTKNRQICCLAEMVIIVLQARRVTPTKKWRNLQFWWNFSANHN